MIRGKVVDLNGLASNQRERELELDFLNAVIPKTADGKVIVIVDEGEILSPIERLKKLALDKLLVTEKKPYNKVIELQK